MFHGSIIGFLGSNQKPDEHPPTDDTDGLPFIQLTAPLHAEAPEEDELRLGASLYMGASHGEAQDEVRSPSFAALHP